MIHPNKKSLLLLRAYILFFLLFSNLLFAQQPSKRVKSTIKKQSSQQLKPLLKAPQILSQKTIINKGYLKQLGNNITTLFPEKNCQKYITKKSGYFLLSFGCSVGYSTQDRTKFLDYLYSNQFYLKNEEYDLENKHGIYIYKFQHREKGNEEVIFIKFFFRNIQYLYPERPLKYNTLAIMVIDISSIQQIYNWQELGIPISYGILPFQKRTKEISQLIKKFQQEPWLAISLEPKKYSPKIEDMLLIEDTFSNKRKVSLFIKTAIDDVKPIGVYNRFGSKFTEDIYATRQVLTLLKKNNILNFLDVFSTKKSVAYKTSQILSLRSYKRDFILHPNLSKSEKEITWNTTLNTSKEKGSTILLVHAEDKNSIKFLKQKIKNINPIFQLDFISNIPVDLQ